MKTMNDDRIRELAAPFHTIYGFKDVEFAHALLEEQNTRAEPDLEEFGRLADTVDNLISAESLPIPAALAKQARIDSLTSLRDNLRAFYTKATGDDPWN